MVTESEERVEDFIHQSEIYEWLMAGGCLAFIVFLEFLMMF